MRKEPGSDLTSIDILLMSRGGGGAIEEGLSKKISRRNSTEWELIRKVHEVHDGWQYQKFDPIV